MPASLVITGPCTLQGQVAVSGAKNAVLPLLISSLLAEENCIWKNVPVLEDVSILLDILRQLGAQIRWNPLKHQAEVDASVLHTQNAPSALVQSMRASILLLGPLVARFGQARVALPGGDAIGTRPIDQHLRGLEAMGAKIQLEQEAVVATASRLRGTSIVFDMPTVGGTENLMMAAALAEGETILHNAAREPEIEDLAQALNAMGAKIQGAGTETISITGVPFLHGLQHTVMPDRIEAGTFLVAATICQGDVWVENARPAHLQAVLAVLREAGARIVVQNQRIHIQGPNMITPFNLTTEPYPGFPTDLQAQFVTLACRAQGPSSITETIFENRYRHVPELVRMGANVRVVGKTAHVTGSALSGTSVAATDIRAAASLVLAGLTAQGITRVQQIDHLDRGYEHFERKLQSLGASIIREM